jgi:hypothetical protein
MADMEDGRREAVLSRNPAHWCVSEVNALGAETATSRVLKHEGDTGNIEQPR